MLARRENLELVGRLYHLGRAERRQRAGRVLEQFQLADAADRPVRTYSGGMRRRPCPRTLSQARRPNDGNLAAWPGRGRALPGPAQCRAFALQAGFCSQVAASDGREIQSLSEGR